jgi:hypothetical protein
MSEDRETPASRAAETPEAPGNPGAPVEETEASRTEVLEAVERSRGVEADAVQDAAAEPAAEEAPRVVEAPQGAVQDPENAELARRQAISEVDTQLNLDVPAGDENGVDDARSVALDELPSAAATSEPPVRDGEIRIGADHPMAALYMQTPMPPEIKGNRGAGVLIALLGALGFAVVYAGVLALWLAPTFPPSTFLSEGLLPWLTSWVFVAAVGAFFVGLALLVLVLGRAGWWAYVLGGFLVGVLVWFAAALAGALTGGPWSSAGDVAPGFTFDLEGLRALFNTIGTTVPVLGAAIVAREATVWFGAWIGARGRRVKRRNADALAEYEVALAEVQAKRP